MTDLTPIECEARLVGLSKQRRKDGDWIEVKFHIHPDDHPAALFILPLGTDCNLSIKGTDESAAQPTDEHSTPEATEPPQEPDRSLSDADRKLIQQAGMLPKNANFRQWLWNFAGPPGTVGAYDQAGAEAAVRRLCGVKSRSLIRFNEPSGKLMNDLCYDFYKVQRGETPEALAEQARMG